MNINQAMLLRELPCKNGIGGGNSLTKHTLEIPIEIYSYEEESQSREGYVITDKSFNIRNLYDFLAKYINSISSNLILDFLPHPDQVDTHYYISYFPQHITVVPHNNTLNAIFSSIGQTLTIAIYQDSDTNEMHLDENSGTLLMEPEDNWTKDNTVGKFIFTYYS